MMRLNLVCTKHRKHTSSFLLLKNFSGTVYIHKHMASGCLCRSLCRAFEFSMLLEFFSKAMG